MRKSYSSFTVADIKALGISIITHPLFSEVKLIEPSTLLIQLLNAYEGIPLLSEKARSEVLIAPVLNEIRLRNPQKITFFSGCQLNVDEKRGLKGLCHFIISTKYNAVFLEKPVLAIVETKNNQDLLDGLPQCISEMYAIQLFNEQDNHVTPIVFGALTNGHSWVFLKLENQQVQVDTQRYILKDLPNLLGVWQTIVDSF